MRRTVSSPTVVVLCAPSGPIGKQVTVARAEHVLAVGMADRQLALQDEHPLLVGLVVIRAQRLAGRQLEHRRADHRAAPIFGPKLIHAAVVAVRVLRVVLERGLEDVERLHARSSQHVADPRAGEAAARVELARAAAWKSSQRG